MSILLGILQLRVFTGVTLDIPPEGVTMSYWDEHVRLGNEAV